MHVFLIHLSLISPKKKGGGQTSLSFAHFQMTGNREKPSVGTLCGDSGQRQTSGTHQALLFQENDVTQPYSGC